MMFVRKFIAVVCIVVLLVAAILYKIWLPQLLGWLNTNSADIGNLDSLIAIVLALVGIILAIYKFGFAQNEAADTQKDGRRVKVNGPYTEEGGIVLNGDIVAGNKTVVNHGDYVAGNKEQQR